MPPTSFTTGPAGYDAAFALRLTDVAEFSDVRYADPVYILMSGLGMGLRPRGAAAAGGRASQRIGTGFPRHPSVCFTRSYVRYSFERFGVTYVRRDLLPRHEATPQTSYVPPGRPRRRPLPARVKACRRHAGAVAPIGRTGCARPAEAVSPDFTYFSPGSLIPGSGLKKDLGGRTDFTVYAHLRFPWKDAPDFANSQSFNSWGDCDFTGRSWGRARGRGAPYSCKVNGRPLVLDESTNYAYPWRDNFCEHRNFYVGQCPGGEGHQGQDIRPSSCTLFNDGADRCQPYLHDVVAAHDGVILRARKQEAVFLFINTDKTHMRVRYMHMNPSQLERRDRQRQRVREGDVIGKVGNYNSGERGTTYHLHFDMQLPTKVGWVFVNPYMTLVTAYERLIGARGTEIKEGDQVPPSTPVAPLIEHPAEAPSAATVPAVQIQETAAVRVKPSKPAHKRQSPTKEAPPRE